MTFGYAHVVVAAASAVLVRTRVDYVDLSKENEKPDSSFFFMERKLVLKLNQGLNNV